MIKFFFGLGYLSSVLAVLNGFYLLFSGYEFGIALACIFAALMMILSLLLLREIDSDKQKSIGFLPITLLSRFQDIKQRDQLRQIFKIFQPAFLLWLGLGFACITMFNAFDLSQAPRLYAYGFLIGTACFFIQISARLNRSTKYHAIVLNALQLCFAGAALHSFELNLAPSWQEVTLSLLLIIPTALAFRGILRSHYQRLYGLYGLLCLMFMVGASLFLQPPLIFWIMSWSFIWLCLTRTQHRSEKKYRAYLQ